MAEAALYDQFAHEYESLCPGIPGDVQFYRALAAAAQGPVLELGCGTGRVTIPIAADGVTTVGLDRAPRMLQIARSNAVTADNPRWIQADMRCFQLRQRFGLIIVPYRGLQHLLGAVDRRRTQTLAFDHLLPGGRLALDMLNIAALQLLAEGMPSARLGPLRDRKWPRLSRVRHEVVKAELLEAGFKLDGVYGGFDGSALVAGSVNAVLIVRRPRLGEAIKASLPIN